MHLLKRVDLYFNKHVFINDFNLLKANIKFEIEFVN